MSYKNNRGTWYNVNDSNQKKNKHDAKIIYTNISFC